MSPGKVDLKIVSERAAQVRHAVDQLRRKGALGASEFRADPDHAAASETYLRRALEALSDLARHLLAKGHGTAASEYAAVAVKCADVGLLTQEEGALLRRMLGYRNRLVHQYLEVGPEELLEIARERSSDLLRILDRLEAAARSLSGH